MSGVLHRLGLMAARRPGRVLASWVLVLIAAVAAFASFGSQFDSEATIPGSEAQAGIDVLERAMPTATGVQGQLVFVAADGQAITDPRPRAIVEDAVRRAAQAPQVATVSDPFETDLVSADGRVAVAQVLYPIKRDALNDGSIEALEEIARSGSGEVVDIEVGGTIFSTGDVPLTATEGVGVLVAIVVLVVTFGSLLAAGATLLTALWGLATGMLGVLLVSNLVSVSSTAPTLAVMIGLAVGIDYALFIVSRHRSQLASGHDVDDSVAWSIATAGSAVITFAPSTLTSSACMTTVRRWTRRPRALRSARRRAPARRTWTTRVGALGSQGSASRHAPGCTPAWSSPARAGCPGTRGLPRDARAAPGRARAQDLLRRNNPDVAGHLIGRPRRPGLIGASSSGSQAQVPLTTSPSLRVRSSAVPPCSPLSAVPR